MAYEWCVANPSRMLVLTSTKPRLIYHIAKRGEYVEIGLPHHCHGGEKYWVSRRAKIKVLINLIDCSTCQFRIGPDSGAIPTRTIPIHMMTIFQAGFRVLNESRTQPAGRQLRVS